MQIDPSQVNLFMNWLPQTTKENLLNPSAKAIGKGVGGIFDMLFYWPIKAGIYTRGKLKAYANKVAYDVSNIPLKYRSTKKFDTTYKIMSNSRYCVNNKVLQSWFAKLLASSVDSRVNNLVSNYFPTVLSNMDIESASFLQKFKKITRFPIGNLYVDSNKKGSFLPFKNDVIDWHWQDPGDTFTFVSCQKAINLLSSFKIINVEFRNWMTNTMANKSYERIKNSFGEEAYVTGVPKRIKIHKGIISLTPLGKDFVRVVSP